MKTDKNVECYTKRYAVRDYPELYIRETKTNEKYVLDTEMKKITLKENEIVNDDNEIVNDSPQRSEIDRESRWNQKQFIFDLLIYNEK